MHIEMVLCLDTAHVSRMEMEKSDYKRTAMANAHANQNLHEAERSAEGIYDTQNCEPKKSVSKHNKVWIQNIDQYNTFTAFSLAIRTKKK